MSEYKQQTAVEWYSDRLLEILGDMVNQFTPKQTLANHYAIREAKAMEKEQHLKTFDDASDIEYNYHINNVDRIEFEQYYTETYGE